MYSRRFRGFPVKMVETNRRIECWFLYINNSIRDPRTKPGWSRTERYGPCPRHFKTRRRTGPGPRKISKSRTGPTKFWKSGTDSERSVGPLTLFSNELNKTRKGPILIIEALGRWLNQQVVWSRSILENVITFQFCFIRHSRRISTLLISTVVTFKLLG